MLTPYIAVENYRNQEINTGHWYYCFNQNLINQNEQNARHYQVHLDNAALPPGPCAPGPTFPPHRTLGCTRAEPWAPGCSLQRALPCRHIALAARASGLLSSVAEAKPTLLL